MMVTPNSHAGWLAQRAALGGGCLARKRNYKRVKSFLKLFSIFLVLLIVCVLFFFLSFLVIHLVDVDVVAFCFYYLSNNRSPVRPNHLDIYE